MGRKKQNDEEDDVDKRLYANINGTRVPIDRIHTIQEIDEYNYDHNVPEYFILINEQNDGQMSVYSNIKIKCETYNQRSEQLKGLETLMVINNCEFIII